MNQGILIPLFALFVWMIAIFAENKFSYFYEDKNAEDYAIGQSGWRKFLIIHNVVIKYIGLVMLWFGFSIASIMSDGRQGIVSLIFYIFGIFGLMVYVVSRIWPFVRQN